jgi:hypothetical protein
MKDLSRLLLAPTVAAALLLACTATNATCQANHLKSAPSHRCQPELSDRVAIFQSEVMSQSLIPTSGKGCSVV